MDDEDPEKVNHAFLVSRKEQCEWLDISLACMSNIRNFIDKQVFPSLEMIGWYTVTQEPTSRHIALHEEVCDRIVDR